MCWKFEPKGVYLIKSVYRSLRVIISDMGVAASQLWSKLWKCRIPSKVINFGWRLIWQVLYCLDTLRRQHVEDVSSSCPMCHDGEKTLISLFLQCSFVRSVCIVTTIVWQFPRATNLLEWFVNVCQVADKNTAEEIIMVLWSIWMARNKAVWNHKFMLLSSILHLVKKVYHDWLVQQRSLVAGHEQQGFSCIWSRLPSSWLNINVDASPNQTQCYVGADAVCHDEFGPFVVAKTWHIPRRVTPQWTEIMAFYEMLSWVKLRN